MRDPGLEYKFSFAVRSGVVSKVRDLLQDNPNIQAMGFDSQGYMEGVFANAVRQENIEMVKLVRTIPHIDTTDALMAAVRASNNWAMVGLLKGIKDLDTKDVLYTALEEEKMDVVRELLTIPNIVSGGSLLLALRRGHDDLVPLLLTAPDIQRELGEAVFFALKSGKLALARSLLKQDIQWHGAGLFSAGLLNAVFNEAVRLEQRDIVGMLLKVPGLDTSDALSAAIRRGNKEMVDFLLTFNSIDTRGALAAAASAKERGLVVFADGALASAIRNHNARVVDFLLDVEDIDTGGALAAAVEVGNVAVAARLLERGVDTAGALIEAVMAENVPMIGLLLSRPDVDTEGAMNVAIRGRNVRNAAVVQALLASEKITRDDLLDVLGPVVRGSMDVLRLFLADPRLDSRISGRIYLQMRDHPVESERLIRLHDAILGDEGDEVRIAADAMVDAGDEAGLMTGARYAAAIGAGTMLEIVLEKLVPLREGRPLPEDAVRPIGDAIRVWAQYCAWGVTRAAWVGEVVKSLLRTPAWP
jgi:ankyrin repeat protein